jgi:hypothetical protein
MDRTGLPKYRESIASRKTIAAIFLLVHPELSHLPATSKTTHHVHVNRRQDVHNRSRVSVRCVLPKDKNE